MVERLHTSIARELGEAITSGKIGPGETLTGEVASSVERSVSRTAYREAVRILAAKGLIESRTRVGTRVSPRRAWNILDPEVLNWFLKTGPDDSFIRDLFELRRVVEPSAAAIAAERANETQISAMRNSLALMARFGLNTEEGRNADVAFHTLLLEATGNAVLLALASSIGTTIRWTGRYKHGLPRVPRDPVPPHEAVLTAIAGRDPQAAREAMAALVNGACADLEESLGSTALCSDLPASEDAESAAD